MHEQSKADEFISAAANSKLALLKKYLEEGLDINCKDSRFGRTALTCAAENGSKKLAEFLLNNGADINSLDGNQMTPLMNACSKGKKKGSEVALLLLQRGADAAYARKSDSMTAIKFALWGQCTDEVLSALLAAGASPPEATFQVIHLV